MRKFAGHVTALIALGAAMNVVIATLAIWFPPVLTAEPEMYGFHTTVFYEAASLGRTRLVWSPTSYGPDGTGATWAPVPERGLPEWSRLHSIRTPYPAAGAYFEETGIFMHVEVCAGWPLRSMIFESEHRRDGPLAMKVRLRDGIPLPQRESLSPAGAVVHEARAIPLRVVPLGFAINTFLFASLAALLWYSPRAVHRAFRKREDRCLSCGYSRAGLDARAACPECGAAGQGAAAT